MTIILVIIHIFVCLFLIAVVLLQSGKGAELGAAFGGSNQTLFGSRGAATFLSKMTTVAAVLFMLTSLILAVVTAKSGSVLKKIPVTQEQNTMPGTTGPIQGAGVQPMQQPGQQTTQPLQKQIPQAQQKQANRTPEKQLPPIQQQTPAPQEPQKNTP